jgi:hypothetical protein
MDEQRHLPVLASEARPIEPAPERMPLAAPAIAATGGMLAGVTAFLLVRVLRRGRDRRRSAIRFGRKRRDRLEIMGSRSFLVDVHVLKR